MALTKTNHRGFVKDTERRIVLNTNDHELEAIKASREREKRLRNIEVSIEKLKRAMSELAERIK